MTQKITNNLAFAFLMLLLTLSVRASGKWPSTGELYRNILKQITNQ